MKLASIEKIIAVSAHPNADKLEFVQVLGYYCIVSKGVYKAEDWVIFIQPDTVLPEVEWSEMYRKFSRKRVKAMRIRGEWSMGIVEQIHLLPPDILLEEGLEVSELLGVTKYEPPLPKNSQGENLAKGGLPFQIPKTDEERYQNLKKLPYGELVDVTLKVDGQSFTAYCKKTEEGWQFGVCGRTLEYDLTQENLYTAQVARYDLENKLKAYCEQHQVSLAIRGESYGHGIQTNTHNPHSKTTNGLALFSVWNLDQLAYERRENPHYFIYLAQALDLPTVPILEMGVELTPELIKKYDEELSECNGLPFEGVVINTAKTSFKVINKHYDTLK